MANLVHSQPTIQMVDDIQAFVSPWSWQWAEENEAAIAENWERRKKQLPFIFDGDVLLARDPAIKGGICSLDLFTVKYSQMLGALDLESSDRNIWNVFAMGALRGSDNAYICAVMGEETANKGQIYFPAGTPDHSDLGADNSVDMKESMLRELQEETQIINGFEISPQWMIIAEWPRLALFRIIEFPDTAQNVADRIEENLKRQEDPELSGAYIIRSRNDIVKDKMPLYLQRFFNHVFPE